MTVKDIANESYLKNLLARFRLLSTKQSSLVPQILLMSLCLHTDSLQEDCFRLSRRGHRTLTNISMAYHFNLPPLLIRSNSIEDQCCKTPRLTVWALASFCNLPTIRSSQIPYLQQKPSEDLGTLLGLLPKLSFSLSKMAALLGICLAISAIWVATIPLMFRQGQPLLNP